MTTMTASADHVKGIFARAAANRKAWLAGQPNTALLTINQVREHTPDGFDSIDRAEFHAVESGRAQWVFDAPTPAPVVRPAPVKTARRFGQGILPTYPTYRADQTASDTAWWTAETARSEDAHYDRLYRESLAQSRLDAGVCC